MPTVLAIDAGTTGVRSRLVLHDGTTAASAYREFTQYFPQPGWVEHDAEEIWNAVVETISEVIARTGTTPTAIGITNQRETVVAWSRASGLPLHRAIVWQDRRTAKHCKQLAPYLDIVRSTTGLVLDPYFSGTKIAWLINEGFVTVNNDLAVGTIDSWLIWNLTGGKVHATDPSNASRTMLFDINEMQWSPDLCAMIGVPINALPTVMPSSGVFGFSSAPQVIAGGIPIAGVVGDQQAALFGQACFSPGQTKNTYGTGSFVLMNVGTRCPPPVEGMLTTVAWDLGNGPTYALEGSIFITGAAVQWLRDGLKIIERSDQFEELAMSVADNGGVYFVPAFAGLGSPWWNADARGAIFGITRGTTRAHLARATLESMVFQTRDVVEAMNSAAGIQITELRVDGGGAVMDSMLQMQADHLGVPVIRPRDREITALGAAYLAGLATGVWQNTTEIADNWHLDRTFPPTNDPVGYEGWLEAIRRL